MHAFNFVALVRPIVLSKTVIMSFLMVLSSQQTECLGQVPLISLGAAARCGLVMLHGVDENIAAMLKKGALVVSMLKRKMSRAVAKTSPTTGCRSEGSALAWRAGHVHILLPCRIAP
jgi:hypothetical protein